MPSPFHAQVPGHPLHVIQRGHFHAPCFFGEQDRAAYLSWLGAYADRLDCVVHAYVLMSNHVHLLLTPSHPEGASRLIHTLRERYTRHIGETRQHGGPLLEERFKALTPRSKRHLLDCMRYIELNPVRAGLVAWPDDYYWSSFRSNALGHEDSLVTPHSCYYALGRSAAARQSAYRGLFRGAKAPGDWPRSGCNAE